MLTPVENLLSMETMAKEAPSISKRTLRHWLYSNLDGFRDRCAVKVGRLVFLDRPAVEAWLSEHRQAEEVHEGQEVVAV